MTIDWQAEFLFGLSNATWAQMGAILVLLVVSGFFSGSETALTAATKARFRQLEKDGLKRAATVRKLIDNREGLIGAILLGNNLVNIMASALATSLFISLVGEAGVIYATGIMTVLVLIFAEVLPKTYALTHAESMSLTVAPLVRAVVFILGPVTHTIHLVVRLTLKIFGIDLSANIAPVSATEEIRGAIDLHEEEGGIHKRQRDMLGGILDLDEVFVEDVMRHRKDLQSFDIDQPVEVIINTVLSSPYTRLPLYRDDPENIIGILHAKTLLVALQKSSENEIDIEKLARSPWFIPEGRSLRAQLNAFRAKREHFALVVDEYGALMGLITLEDVLEEIVGNIEDEHDEVENKVRRLDGAYDIDGDTPIRDVNRVLDWNLPDDNANTIAGLIIHEAREIPPAGAVYRLFGFDFEVCERQANRVSRLRVKLPTRNQVKSAARPVVGKEKKAGPTTLSPAERDKV